MSGYNQNPYGQYGQPMQQPQRPGQTYQAFQYPQQAYGAPAPASSSYQYPQQPQMQPQQQQQQQPWMTPQTSGYGAMPQQQTQYYPQQQSQTYSADHWAEASKQWVEARQQPQAAPLQGYPQQTGSTSYQQESSGGGYAQTGGPQQQHPYSGSSSDQIGIPIAGLNPTASGSGSGVGFRPPLPPSPPPPTATAANPYQMNNQSGGMYASAQTSVQPPLPPGPPPSSSPYDQQHQQQSTGRPTHPYGAPAPSGVASYPPPQDQSHENYSAATMRYHQGTGYGDQPPQHVGGAMGGLLRVAPLTTATTATIPGMVPPSHYAPYAHAQGYFPGSNPASLVVNQTASVGLPHPAFSPYGAALLQKPAEKKVPDWLKQAVAERAKKDQHETPKEKQEGIRRGGGSFTGYALASPTHSESDEEEYQPAAITNEPSTTSTHRNDSDDEESETEEELKETLNKMMKQTLTECLLSVTNQFFLEIAREAVSEAKRKKAVTSQKHQEGEEEDLDKDTLARLQNEAKKLASNLSALNQKKETAKTVSSQKGPLGLVSYDSDEGEEEGSESEQQNALSQKKAPEESLNATSGTPPKDTLYTLERIDGDKTISTHPLHSPVTTLGSSPSCDIVIEHPTVSAIHAEIRFDSSHQPIVIDMRSEGGTRVNNSILALPHSQPRSVKSGDILVLGQSREVTCRITSKPIDHDQKIVEEQLKKPTTTSELPSLSFSSFPSDALSKLPSATQPSNLTEILSVDFHQPPAESVAVPPLSEAAKTEVLNKIQEARRKIEREKEKEREKQKREENHHNKDREEVVVSKKESDHHNHHHYSREGRSEKERERERERERDKDRERAVGVSSSREDRGSGSGRGGRSLSPLEPVSSGNRGSSRDEKSSGSSRRESDRGHDRGGEKDNDRDREISKRERERDRDRDREERKGEKDRKRRSRSKSKSRSQSPKKSKRKSSGRSRSRSPKASSSRESREEKDRSRRSVEKESSSSKKRKDRSRSRSKERERSRSKSPKRSSRKRSPR